MADWTGRTLGKYRLVERLGRGGMAEVYKGYQPSMDRYVAIKLMHAYLAEDEDFVGRFRREARAIASLRHPHIVQAYDFDIQDDVYFMVQEFIQGGTLKDRLRQASQHGELIPIQETARIVNAICDAVDYAHAQGCIHRDIKPDNIMFDDGGRPVLTDFGIAAIVGGTRFTATGSMIGTPAYMSPEQGKGDCNDPRSDIYSLGIVLYEMVAGQVPFDADTPFAVVLKHVNEALPMPSTLNASLNPAVERVILKALAKEPEDRYQSAQALARDLADAVREPDAWSWPTQAPETPPPEVPAAPVFPPAERTRAGGTLPTAAAARPVRLRSRLWLWVAAALVVVVAVGWGVVALISAIQDQPETPAETATGTEAAALIGMGIEALGKDCNGDTETAAGLFERALEEDENAAGAYVGLARGKLCNGVVPEALEYLDQAMDRAPDDALAYYWRGRLWVHEDAGQDAYDDFSHAIVLDPAYAEAYLWRGWVAMYPIEDFDQALADLDRAIELAPELADAHLARGRLYAWHRDDPHRALEDLSAYVALAPDDPEGYAERGQVYLDGLLDYDLAIAEYTLAIERDDQEPSFYQERAWAFVQLQEWGPAIDDCTRALDLALDPELFQLRGMTLYLSGRYEEALADLDKVILIDDGMQGAAHHGQGWIYAAMGQYEAAIEAYDRASAYSWEEYAWPFFEENHWLLDRAAAYRETGRWDEALHDYGALIEMWEGWFLPHYERAHVYRAMGREDEAHADLLQALVLADDVDWQARIVEEMAGGDAE
jgi:tetratricopeptide (TPR) repeat protein/tRNA A-37 threonylcarbamoyl transferase component Bud32